MGKANVVAQDWDDSEAHLKGVNKVLNQEEAAQLLQCSVDVGQTGVHVLTESLGGNADILFYECSAEGTGHEQGLALRESFV